MPANRSGDAIQSVTTDNVSTADVRVAVTRRGLTVDRVAGMHIPLTAWTTIEQLK